MDEKITLAIESSCDETSAAILRGGRQVLSNIISTQIPIHQKFGGVVPEIASRKHIVNIMPVIDEALAKAGVELADIDQIAVTYGPGLVGALLVGSSGGAYLCQFYQPSGFETTIYGLGGIWGTYLLGACKGL